MLRNEFRRVELLSHNDEAKVTAKEKLTRIFERNGYSHSAQQRILNNRRRTSPTVSNQTITAATFHIPYVSEQFTERIRRAIRTSGLNNVITRVKPGLQLRHALKKLKYPWHCEKRNCPIANDELCFRNNVVYKLVCLLCNECYIGSTTRHMHERAIEHARAAKNPLSYRAFAIANHYIERHSNLEPQLSFNIIDQCRSELECKVSEATHIHRDRPQMNGKSEFDMVYTALLI